MTGGIGLFIDLKKKSLIGAVFLMLVLGCSNDPTRNIEAFIHEELVPYPNDYLKIAPNLAASTFKEQTFKLYDQGRFDQALILFDELPQYDLDESTAFFRANALIAQQQYDLALPILSGISAKSEYYLQAQWYQILLHLKKEEYQIAKKKLENFKQIQGAFKTAPTKELSFILN